MQFGGLPLLPPVREGVPRSERLQAVFLDHICILPIFFTLIYHPVLPERLQRSLGYLEILSSSREWGNEIKKGKILIREYLTGIKHICQIRHLYDFNPDILHVPDIGPVHLF